MQVSHGLVELSDVDILLVEFLTQGLQLSLFLFELLLHVVDQFLQFLTLERAVAQLLLQFVDELLVLTHGLLDELHVLLDALGRIGALTRLGERDTALGLGNLTETFLDVAEGSNHVIDLIVLLGNDLVK